eukprot:10496270-Alexandrium_andersonii.AAC.1
MPRGALRLGAEEPLGAEERGTHGPGFGHRLPPLSRGRRRPDHRGRFILAHDWLRVRQDVEEH